MLNIGVAPETACPSSSWGSESRKWFFTLPVHRLVLGEQWSWKRILPFPHVSSMRVDPGNGYVPSSSFVRCRLPLAHARRAAMLCARRMCATRFLAFEVATSDPMLWFVSGSPAEARVRPQYFVCLSNISYSIWHCRYPVRLFMVFCGRLNHYLIFCMPFEHFV